MTQPDKPAPQTLPEITGNDVAKLILWLEKLTDQQVEMVRLQVQHAIERREYVKKGFKK